MSLVGTVDQAEEKAREKGLVCVMPKPNELFIDIDSALAYETFQAGYALLREGGQQVEIVRETPSPSGKPWRKHIVIDLRRTVKSEIERIALQAILGSDLKREALSWLHLQSGTTDVSRLFEKPQPVEEIESF
jgi:hypothetical protein